MAHHPTLFIGLGGSGGKTLAHLKRLLLRGVTRAELDENYRFVILDTDESAWDTLRRDFDSEFQADPGFLDRGREWYHFGGFNPQRRWQEIKTNPRTTDHADILRWIDPATAESFPDQVVTIGAEARRQLGRFCFAQHFRPIRTLLLSQLESLNDIRGQQDIARHVQIVIVTSSCGGTGSSVFFDTLYMLSVLYNGIAKSAPFVAPVIYSPLPFIRSAKAQTLSEELISRYNANAAAFFLELQYAFSRYHSGQGYGSDSFVLPSWSEAAALKVNWKPFDDTLILDAQREGTPSFIPFDNLYSTVAELLFYQRVSSVNAAVKQQAVNQSPDIRDETHGTYPYYSTAGFRALEYPGKPLEIYLKDRFAADLIDSRLLREGGPSQSSLQKRAKDLVRTVILAPLRSEQGGNDEHDFAAFARQQYFGSDSQMMRRFGSIDEFSIPDPSKPDAVPKIDPSSLTRERLTAAINELHQEIRSIKAAIRGDFVARFGRLSRLDSDTYYGRVVNDLQSEMEAVIDQDGIASWSGLSDREDSGLAWHLLEEIAARKQRALEALGRSNERRGVLEGNLEGLEHIKEEVLATAESSGGVLSIWRGRGDAALRKRLERFAAKRIELIEESLQNVLLMLEIEILTHVGSRRPTVSPAEYFSVQDVGVPSLLRRLKDQGTRIRNWLGVASALAHAGLDATEAALREQAQSLLTVYEPPLNEVMNDGKPGPLAQAALARLFAAADESGSVVKSMSEGTGRPFGWRDVAPSPDSASLDLADAFLDGIHAFVGRTVSSDPELRTLTRRSIEDSLAELAKKAVDRYREMLGVGQVPVFSPVSAGVVNRPKFRLLVTASGGSDGSVATKLGYKPGDQSQSHLSDPQAPHRVLAIKVYSGLYLEADFPWYSEVRHYYDNHLVYEPHLWKDGRVRVAGGGSLDRWRRAYAVGLAWAFLLQGDKWKKDESVRDLFTERLPDEPDRYLHEGPFTLRRREPHFLELALTENMVTSTGRIECRLEGIGFVKVGKAGDYGTAWTSFLKRPRMLASAEFFHLWCGGVRHDFSDDSRNPSTVIENEDRARKFLEWLPPTLVAVRARREELERLVNRTAEDDSTHQTLGWVAGELEREQTAIQAALQDTSL